MANRHKGEVSATIDGTEYTLRIAANEWCDLEDEFDKPTTEIVQDFFKMVEAGDLRMKVLRSFFRAALTGQHPDTTHHEAGAIMSAMGLVNAAALLGRVILASMPEADEKEGAAGSRPPKAAKA